MSAAGAALTAEYRRGQVALRAQVVRDAYRLWASWQGTSKAEWNRLLELAYPILAARHTVSAGASARYFETISALETGSRQAAVMGRPLPVDQVSASLTFTGLVSVYNARQRGLSLEAAKQIGFVKFSGAMSRLALNGGRDTILESVEASGRATGWIRVTSASPCDFCASLADMASTPEAFQAHDHCSCIAAPVFE